MYCFHDTKQFWLDDLCKRHMHMQPCMQQDEPTSKSFNQYIENSKFEKPC